jgi:hypothetical protein
MLAMSEAEALGVGADVSTRVGCTAVDRRETDEDRTAGAAGVETDTERLTFTAPCNEVVSFAVPPP